MGYRRLLQRYLAHVDQLLGSSLVEQTPASGLFTQRDLGQLKGLAAEAAREKSASQLGQLETGKADNVPPDLGGLLAETIRHYNLSVEEVARISATDVTSINRWCYGSPEMAAEKIFDSPNCPLTEQEFTRVLAALLVWKRS